MSKNRRNDYVFYIERAIATWRQFLEHNPSLYKDDLDELEDHLRNELDSLSGKGISDEERFRIALRRVGDLATLSTDYGNVLWEKRMRRDRVLTEVIAAFRLFHSYFKTAWSGIVRHKAYAFLNLSGLAIALTACIIIVLYVQHELSYDNYHSKADRIYRLELDWPNYPLGNNRWSSTFWPVGPGLKSSIPEIETVTRVSRRLDPLIQVNEIRFFEDKILFAGPEFFDVFDFEFISGAPGSLNTPQTIFLSESVAAKYFPSSDALGQRIQVSERSSDEPQEFEVVGVFNDMPSNSHFGTHFIASFASIDDVSAENEWFKIVHTYLTLHPDVPPSTVFEKLEAYWAERVRNGPDQSREESAPFLQPLSRIHLYSSASGDIEPQGDIMYVMMFALAATLLLIVACVNYMNLAVARYAARAREVGIRKVVGANRAQLIWQFLGESIVYCSLSFLLAIVVVALTLPYFNSTMDLSLSLGTHYATVLKSFIPSIVIVGLLAGSYPAFFLSRFAPTTVLKGALGSGRRAVLRKGLLLFQFVITSGLIIATIVISAQLKFAQDKKLGFENEQLLILKTRGALEENSSSFRDALEQIPGVESVSFAYSFPGRATAMTWYRGRDIEEYEGDTVLFDHVWADTAFVRTVGLEVVAGRAFSAERTGDSERGIVLNQAAVRAIGWSDPIGKRLGEGDNAREVIGVVRDFHTKSMYEEIAPFMFELGEQKTYTGLRVLTGNLRQTMEDVKATWEVFIPDRPFEYSFLDDDFKAMYRKETRLGRLFTAFSVLTIVIAVLGLFGLVAFSAQQRTKEIGIRKALGATASNITVLLSREFAALVSVSFIASTPLIYWIMTEWLNQFAYRVDLSAGLFFLSGTIILSVAMFTVGVQAARTALIPPVDCLRQE